MLKATVLIDNIAEEPLQAEWGLSIYIEYNDKKILLDAGASDLFLSNAKTLEVDLNQVDYAVLSHAHFDHADGMDAFFSCNLNANLYLREDCKENCFSYKDGEYKYIGIRKGILDDFKDRIVYVRGDYQLSKGVWLIPHKTEGLHELGRRNHQYVCVNGTYIHDDYHHEQSLVFETDKGLVVFNSCCHGGVENIIREIEISFPGKKIHALIGGFHLYRCKEEDVFHLADQIKGTDLQVLYTGHCTGKEAYDVLKSELKDKIQPLETGLQIQI